MKLRLAGLVLFLLGQSVPLPGMSHDLDAPGMVEAAVDGSFSYEWVFTAGPGSALFAGAGWDALANVSGAMHGDCFCVPEICLLQEGETRTFPVRGNLQDLEQQGSVLNWVALCGETGLSLSTVIMPYGTVPLESITWSSIKALYR